MSQEGIDLTAEVFSIMQQAREKLMRIGAEDCRRTSGQQDILLSHLLGKANDAIKDEFMHIIKK
jgi:hypothetical protein